MTHQSGLPALVVALLAAGAVMASALEYPEAPPGDHVDRLHGERVADPWRWLEDHDAETTRDWVKAQNDLSRPFLAELPDRPRLERRLTELWNFERRSVPRHGGDARFHAHNDGLQNQPVLYVQRGDAPARPLVDPNALDEGGKVALTQWEPSPDGRYVAYGLAVAGSDWNEIRVVDTVTGDVLDDTLRRVKFSGISWARDSQGFYYSRYPDPPAEDGTDVFEELQNQSLHYHRAGTPQSEDLLIYSRPDRPKWFLTGEVSHDGRFLFVAIHAGTSDRNALHYAYLGEPGKTQPAAKVVPLIDDFRAEFTPLHNEKSVLYLLTDWKAPRKKIIAIDLRAPDPKHWITLVPQGPDAIDGAWAIDRGFTLLTMDDAVHRLKRYTWTGKPLPDVELPGLGSVPSLFGDTEVSGRPGIREWHFAFTTVNRPPAIWRCGRKANSCAPAFSPELKFDPDEFVTRRVFYESRDGTRVPLFISHRRGLREGRRAPTYLFGYGGFAISKLPEWDPKYGASNLVWMEQGGIYASASLRGGGEYGEAWHEAGRGANKQNVFDDFIAAGEYLVEQGYTRPDQLAVGGRSNGGLLVGAVVNQRPDLFAAALPMVGVMDMLRFHRFTIGWAWTDDYGSPDDADDFNVLRAYSPYHNVRPGAQYPAVLVTTADHDDRVVPAHSYKYTAAMQAAQAGDKPILIRIDVDAGHGSGKPTAQLIDEEADKLAFLTRFTRGN